jgi:FkbM family methyltransferase
MVSYAQNFEDVMLWRALADIPKGTYVDVGAAWPRADSVTCWFYDQGWSGLNIEPNPDLYAQLAAVRERDTNLCLAAFDQRGSAILHLIADTGLSTLSSALAARQERADRTVRTIETPTMPLREILDTYLDKGRDVHFLKIDVEGHEANVVISNDWEHFRPWIVVVEAIHPVTSEQSHQAWEPILLGSGYEYAYFDGINRFYVATERRRLKQAFRLPPNALDGFVSVRQRDAEDMAWRLQIERRLGSRVDQALLSKWQHLLSAPIGERQRKQAFLLAEALAVSVDIDVSSLDHAQEEIESLRAALASTQAHLDAVVRSRTWRLTRPVRSLRNFLSAPMPHLAIAGRRVVGPTIWLLMRRPRRARIIAAMFSRVPWLGPRLRRHADCVAAASHSEEAGSPTADTQRVLAALPDWDSDG